MKNVYYLQIEVEFSKIHLIDKIMGIKHNTISSSWQYMIVEKELLYLIFICLWIC